MCQQTTNNSNFNSRGYVVVLWRTMCDRVAAEICSTVLFKWLLKASNTFFKSI